MTTLSRRNLLKAGAIGVPAAALAGRPALAAAPLPVVETSGSAPVQLAGFDKVMKTFVQDRKITAAQLAIMKSGRIVLARGYRYNDFSRALPTVSPTSLFRIASVSKNITSAAIMRLVQDGKLSLSAKVTQLLGLTPADPRMAQVTVLRLMQHLGGWDKDVSKDQLWLDHTIAATLDVPLPIGHADIIRYATARQLDFDPGTKMVYSNYGYMLLGRIIAKVSGTSYESYIKTKLLQPLGITRMRLGKSLRSQAAPGEIAYESQYTNKSVVDTSGTVVPFPYGGFNMPNQDANGGWLASAVDLVRWTLAFDKPGTVLSSASIAKLVAKPEIGINEYGSWYGGGWWVRQVTGHLNTWHNGSMPGTFTYLARLQNGFSYAVLFNRREESGSLDYDTIDDDINKVSVSSWPQGDLTGRYF
ncbi:serine hydrolase domain-containing protein [Nonomuraea basaltis]|uniref:serine hydrolase domain-containing protein n=1 Tax=Nonomuraea basaltis TaxID=2495887 RepID=UPI00110C5328|nr:serine hydrolase domain-containing protein [Nonomuraea basaltis]TMR96488.1 beta-lactamase family protein [Nonomuraea basaltis]